MIIKYLIMFAHFGWVLFCVRRERALLRTKYIGPLAFAVICSFVPYFVSKCGLVEYSGDNVIEPDLLVFSANLVLGCTGLLAYKLLGYPNNGGNLLLDPVHPVGKNEFSDYKLVRNLLTFFFILAVFQSAWLMYSYGIRSIFENAAEFHLWLLDRAAQNSYLENALMILGGAGPLCLGAAFYFWVWRSLQGAGRVVGAFVLLYTLAMAIFYSRAILVVTIVPLVMVFLFCGCLNLTRSYKLYLWAGVFAGIFSIVTIRRALYLGSESGFALLGYFGITSTIFTDWFIQTRACQVILTVITYTSSSFSNLSNIIANADSLQYAYGMMSMRVINPIFSLISPEFGALQRQAVGENTELLIISSPGGGQWSMAYGAAFLDMGLAGVYFYAIFIAVLLAVSVRVASLAGPSLKFAILYILYFVAFMMFQMPFLAAHHGIFLGLVLFFLMVLVCVRVRRSS